MNFAESKMRMPLLLALVISLFSNTPGQDVAILDAHDLQSMRQHNLVLTQEKSEVLSQQNYHRYTGLRSFPFRSGRVNPPAPGQRDR
jgi:hypothetical protein